MKGAFDDAEKLIDEALRIYPDNPFYLSVRGLCIGMNGDIFTGEKLCRQALEMASRKDPMLYVNIGRLLLSEGKRAEARKNFKKAYELDNTNSPAALQLSKMGVRKKPVLRFLRRDHFLNIQLGRLRHAINTRRAGQLKNI